MEDENLKTNERRKKFWVLIILAFSNLTCHLEDTGRGVFWLLCVVCGKETELESSDQEASPTVGTTVCPYSNFWWCRYFQGPWVLFVMTDEFSVRVTKRFLMFWWWIDVFWTHSLPFCFLFLTNFNSMNYGHIIKWM